jgi:hypothetical protein
MHHTQLKLKRAKATGYAAAAKAKDNRIVMAVIQQVRSQMSMWPKKPAPPIFAAATRARMA